MYSLSLPSADQVGRTRLRLARFAAGVISVLVASSLLGSSGAAVAVVPAEISPTPTPTTPTLPNPTRLAAKLAAVSAKKIDRRSILVSTPDGTVLSYRSAGVALAPASTMKLVTTMAALQALGAETRFTTKVVGSGTSVVLVGGGDPLLTDKTSIIACQAPCKPTTSVYRPASLQRLAATTVAALKASGRTSVRLGYDATLFSGPTFSRYWKSTWKSSEAKVSALEIGSGKTGWKAQKDPAQFAAKAFAARLKRAGISVKFVGSVKASPAATVLATTTSASLALIVKRTLLLSDNVAAETISRHAALANGQAASFAGAGANVRAWLAAHGLWSSGQRILDGSGLAPGNRLTAANLAAAMRLALADPTYTAVIAGLPVAWETGTLSKRFNDRSERAGRHNVHAKTGTLKGVASLVGYLTTTEGDRLVFAEIANSAKPVSYTQLYNWLDRSAAAIITCACP